MTPSLHAGMAVLWLITFNSYGCGVTVCHGATFSHDEVAILMLIMSIDVFGNASRRLPFSHAEIAAL
eukprot:12408130-Karenia_brevis.AAC.1